MNEFRKNVVVGAVVLTALIALGTMIILFGEAPQALTSVYRVSMYFPTAGTIQNADPVYVNGVQVGQVEYTAAMSDIRKGVQIVTAIQTRYRIPIDAVPFIKEQGVGFGNSSIRIDVDERNSSTMLPTDGSASLQGQVGGGAAEFIPKQTLKAIEDAGAALADLAKGLRPVADDLHALLKPTTTQEADSTTQPDRPLANLSTAVQRLDQTLKGLNQIVADPNNQKNIRVTLENFRTVSKDTAALAKELREVTNKTDQRLERVSRGLIENTDKLSHLLDSLKQASDKLSTSEGRRRTIPHRSGIVRRINLQCKTPGTGDQRPPRAFTAMAGKRPQSPGRITWQIKESTVHQIQKKHSIWIQCKLAILLVSLTITGCTDPIFFFNSGDLPFNFHELDAGKAYRSSQPTAEELKNVIDLLGIKTVINLRGPNPDEPWYNDELRVCREMDVTLVDHRMSAGSLPKPELLREITNTLQTDEYTILINC